MDSIPAITIIIPHHSGDILSACLNALYAHTQDHALDVIIIDDSPRSDGSVARALDNYPHIRVLRTKGEAGFGANCNLGFLNAKGKYAVLLNNDVEVAAGWLAPLIAAMENDPALGICQPKILSLNEKTEFDRGGGAGGMMDIFAYPFALGSFVKDVETDHGQYDAPRDLFWAHGSAMVIRLAILDPVGLFDEEFHMQAEEIDLCCRTLMSGFQIRSVPSSVVYHHFGWTLKTNSVLRYYLSHRNTMVVMLKNWPLGWLVWAFPVRVLFELMTMLYGIFFRRDWKQPAGVAWALAWLFTHPLNLLKRRRQVLPTKRRNYRRISERIYKGSIIGAYFIGGIRTSAGVLK